MPAGFSTIGGKTYLVKTGATSGTDYDVPVMIGFPKSATAQTGNDRCPCGPTVGCAGQKNWMSAETAPGFALSIDDATGCCRTFLMPDGTDKVAVDVALDEGLVREFLNANYEQAIKDLPVGGLVGGLNNHGWAFSKTDTKGGGTFTVQLVGFPNSQGHKCKQIDGPADYFEKIYATAEFSIASYSKKCRLEICTVANMEDPNKPGPGREEDLWIKKANGWLASKVWSCSEELYNKHTTAGASPKSNGTIILWMAYKYKSAIAANREELLTERKKTCVMIHPVDDEEDEADYTLSFGDNYLDILSGDGTCKDRTCQTGELFRKYLTDIMAAELAIGGFPFLVADSVRASQIRIIGGLEIYTGYKMDGRRVEKFPIAEKVIMHAQYKKSWRLKPSAYTEHPDWKKIGFAIDSNRVGKEPGLKDEDVWTLDVFAEMSKSVVYQMIMIWQQTIEASVGYPSDSGLPWYKKIGGSGMDARRAAITALQAQIATETDPAVRNTLRGLLRTKRDNMMLQYIKGPGGVDLTKTAPDVYLTAHELEMYDTFINQYETFAATAGFSLRKKSISFDCTVNTSGDSYKLSTSMTIEGLLGVLRGNKDMKKDWKDSLVITPPTFTMGGDGSDKSPALEDIHVGYTLQAGNNWTFSVSGLKPFSYLPKKAQTDENGKKDLTPRSPINLMIDYKAAENTHLTIDTQWGGDGGQPFRSLGLTHTVTEDSILNGVQFLRGSNIQTGLTWNDQSQKFTPSWALQKSITDNVTLQIGKMGPKLTYQVTKQYGSKSTHLGKIDLGFTASLSGAQGWNMAANLTQERTVVKTGTFLGNLVWNTYAGIGGGMMSGGALSGWSIKGGAWTGGTLDNGILHLFGMPFNVNPSLGVGVSFLLGDVTSTYFGSNWSGVQWGMNFGLFGITIEFAGRKDTVKAIMERRRYGYWFNIWGLAPWGPKETDEDFIGRAWPCILEKLKEWAEKDWLKRVEVLSVPACHQLKDMYFPLENLDNVDSWEEAKWFYEYWAQAKINPGLRATSRKQLLKYRTFKSWAPVVLTNKVFFTFPLFDVEDLQNNFNNQAYKAYLYYKREKLFGFKRDVCIDRDVTMNECHPQNRAWVNASYKNFPRGERHTTRSSVIRAIAPLYSTNYIAKKSSFKVRWIKEYSEKHKNKWIMTQIKKDLPSKITLLGNELDSINEENSITSQFYKQYMTTRSGAGDIDHSPLFKKDKFLKEHKHFPVDSRQGAGKAWTEQGFTFILADATTFISTMIHGDKVWDPEAIDKKTGKEGAYVEKPSATEKWVSDPFWGLVKCYWTRKAPWGPTDDETKNCRPYDPQSWEAQNNREKRSSAHEPLVRKGWVYKDRSMNDQGVIKLVVPWDQSPGKVACGDSILGGLFYNPDYPKLGWYFNSPVQMTMQAADKENKRVGPVQPLTHMQETEHKTWKVPNMAQVPWKGDSRSCYLTFYEYMNAVEQDLLEDYMDQKSGAGGKKITDFQYAKESIIEYCGYSHNLSDNLAVYYCDPIRLEADKGGNIHSFQPDFIGSNIKVPGDGELPTSASELAIYRNQVEHWKQNKATPAAVAQFDHLFKRGRKIQGDLTMFPAGYLLNELSFMYKEEVQIILDKGQSAHYPDGGFVGWYHNGEKVTNLTELTTLRDLCRRYGSVNGALEWGTASSTNYNVIAILSDALEIVSDPADGHEYSAKIINQNQISEPVGRKKAFSNTLQVRNRLQEVWNLINCSSNAFDSEPLPRETLFDWAVPGTLGHGTILGDRTWAERGQFGVQGHPNYRMYSEANMDVALAKSYGVFNTRYATIWNTFVQVFEDLYPLKISDKANEVAELTLSDRKLFYGLVVKDLGLANIAVMSMFEPWIQESLAIVNLAQTGQITSAEAVYRLKILLRPFMKNYPAGYSITDLERTYLLSFRTNMGGPLNTGTPVKTSDSRYLGINDGKGWLASEKYWVLNKASKTNHHRVKLPGGHFWDNIFGEGGFFARAPRDPNIKLSEILAGWIAVEPQPAKWWEEGRLFYHPETDRYSGGYYPDCNTIMVGTKPESQCEKLLGDVLYYLFNMSEIMSDVRTELVKKGKTSQIKRNTASIYIKNMGPAFNSSLYNLNRNPVSPYNVPALGDSTIWDTRVKKRGCEGSSLFYRGM